MSEGGIRDDFLGPRKKYLNRKKRLSPFQEEGWVKRFGGQRGHKQIEKILRKERMLNVQKGESDAWGTSENGILQAKQVRNKWVKKNVDGEDISCLPSDSTDYLNVSLLFK